MEGEDYLSIVANTAREMALSLPSTSQPPRYTVAMKPTRRGLTYMHVGFMSGVSWVKVNSGELAFIMRSCCTHPINCPYFGGTVPLFGLYCPPR